MIQPSTNATTWLREHAHNLLPLVGLLMAMQAPVTAFLVADHTPGLQYADLAFGVLGVFVTGWSKHIDSSAFTASVYAQAQQDVNRYIPPQAQQLLGLLDEFQTKLGGVMASLQPAPQPVPLASLPSATVGSGVPPVPSTITAAT